MYNRGQMYMRRKMSANDWTSSKTQRAIMEDHSSTHPFPNLHLHHHLPSFPLSLHSSETGFSTSIQDSLEPFESGGEEPSPLFSASNTSSEARRGSKGRVFLDTSVSSVDEDLNVGDNGHFDDSWYERGKKDVWDEDNFQGYDHASDVFYSASCEEGARRGRVKANYGDHAHETKAYAKDAARSSFQDSNLEFCRVDSRGREEDYGSSCGSGEDQLQPAEVEGPWISVSPSNQGQSRWRGATDNHTLTPTFLPQIAKSATQKLDSFSEAFLSRRKRSSPLASCGQICNFDPTGEETTGLLRSRQSCAFESYLPPLSSSSSLSPSHASPPSSSQLMSSVLSPPPTPLPPPSHSPSKLDSPGDPFQFFPSHVPSLLPSAGLMWKFPLLSHCFPQTAGDIGNNDLTSPHNDDFNTTTHDVLQSPQSPFFTSSSSLHPSRALRSPLSPSLHTSFQLPARPPHPPDQLLKVKSYVVSQREKNGPACLNQSQQPFTPLYSGILFPSVLHSSRSQKNSHYTPQPLLNPLRKGTGLYSSLSSLHHRGEEADCRQEGGQSRVPPCVNVGPDFQADLPPCCEEGESSEVCSTGEDLLWKPWNELERSSDEQDQVEKLLSLCSSSCLPGGGSNTELALHCLQYCQGNTMAALEMLLFSHPTPTGDYHYSGSDSWTDTEKSLFSASLGAYGKDFAKIQKMVKTKTVRQCVEFYYLGKKLQEKQKKPKEEESRDGKMPQQKQVTPIHQPVERQFVVEEVVPAPPLASFFPCKLCGKMFYKIKSRNAHMKIHRQSQEDWTTRGLQHQLLTQRLALTHPPNLPPLSFPSSGLTGPSNSHTDNFHNSAVPPINTSVLHPSPLASYGNITLPNSQLISCMDGGEPIRREPISVSHFHQSWGSFGHLSDPNSFYSNPEVKKEPLNWP